LSEEGRNILKDWRCLGIARLERLRGRCVVSRRAEVVGGREEEVRVLRKEENERARTFSAEVWRGKKVSPYPFSLSLSHSLSLLKPDSTDSLKEMSPELFFVFPSVASAVTTDGMKVDEDVQVGFEEIQRTETVSPLSLFPSL
jgi:hypothetical protein